MAEMAIEVQNLTKKFKESVVLKNINMGLEKGKIHGLIGRNGSGKTMLLKCICGFVPPTSGRILVRGKEVGKEVDIPPDMGIIIEEPGFLAGYSALKNLKFLAMIRGKIGEKQIRGAIQKVGLDPDSKKHVGKYSMGMRQRLGLAQAIMEEPDILLLDEPMNGLDNRGVAEMRKLLLELKEKGATIVLASHSQEDISILCDTVRELDHGEVISERG